MAITECGKGHVYDTEQYAACPYCNGGRNIIHFDDGGAGGAGNRTMAPGMMGRGAESGFSAANQSAGEPGKTVAPAAYRKRMEEENKTVGIFRKENEYEPVVGWLVCIEGPQKGKDFRLWARINSIGRSESNDVCIREDNTISKINHARLAYDTKHNNFQLIPGDSMNNIYLNDEPVYTPVRLSAYDLIEFGSTRMVFMPFCSDRFQWTTGLQREE